LFSPLPHGFSLFCSSSTLHFHLPLGFAKYRVLTLFLFLIHSSGNIKPSEQHARWRNDYKTKLCLQVLLCIPIIAVDSRVSRCLSGVWSIRYPLSREAAYPNQKVNANFSPCCPSFLEFLNGKFHDMSDPERNIAQTPPEVVQHYQSGKFPRQF
jgi:hypothetical protein